MNRHNFAAAIQCLAIAVGAPACIAVASAQAKKGPPEFGSPERVEITGYTQDAMEPFITRDGRYLLFNNSNAPTVDTNLQYAERQDDLTFVYRGELAGANSSALDGVPSADVDGNFYFVSTRSYPATFSTLYRGIFSDGVVTGVELVPGVSRQQPGIVNFDAEISYDGNTLIFVDGHFNAGSTTPDSADLVIAQRNGMTFERVANSGEIFKKLNSKLLEYAPCLSRDGLELFFTRVNIKAAHPRPQIFHSWRTDTTQPFGAPRKIKALSGFVEAPTLSPDEHSLYFHKLDGNQFVIYRATR